MQEDWDRFVASVKDESERSVVIVCSAYVEGALEEYLKKRLHPAVNETRLFQGPAAPMGSFSAKIELAYATGLISKTLTDALRLLRTIRNDFAHSIEVEKLGSIDVRSRVQALREMFAGFLGMYRPYAENVLGAGERADFILITAWMYTYLRFVEVPQAVELEAEWVFSAEGLALAKRELEEGTNGAGNSPNG